MPGIFEGEVTGVTGETFIASQARDVGVGFVAHVEVIDRNRWTCAGCAGGGVGGGPSDYQPMT